MAALFTIYGIVVGFLFLFGFLLVTARPNDTKLALSPDELPATTVGAEYDVEITVFHGASPLSRAVVTAGDLPPGISLVVDLSPVGGVYGGASTYPRSGAEPLKPSVTPARIVPESIAGEPTPRW
jgi:hypothetical protein